MKSTGPLVRSGHHGRVLKYTLGFTHIPELELAADMDEAWLVLGGVVVSLKHWLLVGDLGLVEGWTGRVGEGLVGEGGLEPPLLSESVQNTENKTMHKIKTMLVILN